MSSLWETMRRWTPSRHGCWTRHTAPLIFRLAPCFALISFVAVEPLICSSLCTTLQSTCGPWWSCWMSWATSSRVEAPWTCCPSCSTHMTTWCWHRTDFWSPTVAGLCLITGPSCWPLLPWCRCQRTSSVRPSASLKAPQCCSRSQTMSMTPCASCASVPVSPRTQCCSLRTRPCSSGTRTTQISPLAPPWLAVLLSLPSRWWDTASTLLSCAPMCLETCSSVICCLGWVARRCLRWTIS
mmetsp:Transcript_19849/g.63043  ORF Transcript_19849/g.63043 Transcript_19849/m.63043 type:complete len:240 (+) Transcript_19849:2365-3084(+)